jgi:NAD(P)-dependent dehydrogenase (short-subunit alcohol dehydrogenase family)
MSSEWSMEASVGRGCWLRGALVGHLTVGPRYPRRIHIHWTYRRLPNVGNRFQKGKNMSNNVWFITGSARGMGVDLSKAALAAGHSVVATARDAAKVTAALGEHPNLLALSLDITDSQAAIAAAEAAVERFGRIDVLVNNAGNFYAGYFEEISDAQMRKQMETNFFGPLNVTRAILPVMRKQRAGKIVNFSSAAGIIGQEFCAAYAASKFAIEGWTESLRFDVAPYGITTTIVEPGFFRTELLVDGSSIWPELSIDDYKERTEQTIAAWKGMNGQQGGDPAKLARALVEIVALDEPPLRWVAGADAVAGVEAKAGLILEQVDAHRELSSSLDIDDAEVRA